MDSETTQTRKHETRISSSSSSSSSSESSTDTIEKEQLVIETKQVVSEIDIDNKKHSHQKSSTGGSSTTSPSINGQMIVQGGAYDPNRIPASVFTSNSKPGTPMEWSVASNESLFSIHMGNNSFSRDHVFMLYRSGEFPRLDCDQPMNTFPDSSKPPIPVRKSEANSNNSKLTSDELELAGSNTKSISLEPEKNVFHDKNHVEELRNSCSSTQSFQFPLLEIGGNNFIKGAENLQSPKTRGLNEHVEQQRVKPPAPAPAEPKQETPPPERSTWLSFFSCCSAAK